MNIAIIGAGPRGLSLCERLIAQASINQQSLSLTLIDPYPPGGAIWQTNQPQSLLLNSVTSQVTLFTDETLETGGPINPGPSLYEWQKKKDGRNFAKKISPHWYQKLTSWILTVIVLAHYTGCIRNGFISN